MKRLLVLMILALSFVSVNAFGWEMYVSNESSNSITVYDQAGGLIKTITDPSIVGPRQLAFRANGNLYVACGSSKIVIIDQNQNVIGGIVLPFQGGGLAIGSNNHLYVGLTNNPAGSTIQEYDENNNFVESFNGGISLLKPDAMTIGQNNNLFVSDSAHSQVVEFDLNGNLVNEFSTSAGSSPTGVAFGPDGFIYVSRDLINDIGVFNPTTFTLERVITGVGTFPYGITFDPENHHLFVAHFGGNNILEYLYTGEFVGVFASGLSGPDHIAFKSSVTSTTTTTVNGSTFYPALIPKTGQTISYATGDDGALQKGVAWPIPRFTDNGNGTVTDNLTGLMWIKDAQIIQGKMTWEQALNACNNLDYAGYGDWRMPNVKEILSLLDYGQSQPSLPSGHPFINVQTEPAYWTSTDLHNWDGGGLAVWHVDFIYGGATGLEKKYQDFVWPVRGPVTPSPTRIELSSLQANPSDKKVVLKWQTETEPDNAGYNIWRAEGFVKVNNSMIPALGSSVSGSEYDFVDQWVLNGKRYFYLLEDIDTNGISTFHGPIQAVPRWWYGVGR